MKTIWNIIKPETGRTYNKSGVQALEINIKLKITTI
jgi:hypothetical protein